MTRRRPICHLVVSYMFKLYFSCVLTNWTIKHYLIDWLKPTTAVHTRTKATNRLLDDSPTTRFPTGHFLDRSFPRQDVLSGRGSPVTKNEQLSPLTATRYYVSWRRVTQESSWCDADISVFACHFHTQRRGCPLCRYVADAVLLLRCFFVLSLCIISDAIRVS